MKSKIVILCLVFLSACGSSKMGNKNNGMVDYGNPKVKQVLKDANTFRIQKVSRDSTYGYTIENPIMVGGSFLEGPLNERRFLNALTGPKGEPITYVRNGSCCEFKTKNSFSEGDSGFLDIYEVGHKGLEKVVVLYINMYDSDTLRVPVGFGLK